MIDMLNHQPTCLHLRLKSSVSASSLAAEIPVVVDGGALLLPALTTRRNKASHVQLIF